jgi:hypothetical protein
MKYLIIAMALAVTSCATREPVDREVFNMSVGTDSEFESIELHEVKRLAIDAKARLRMANRTYIKNQFDCEDYVRHLINTIMLHHEYTKTPLIYSVVIREADGGLHAVMGFKNNKKQEILYDPQNYKVIAEASKVRTSF